MPSPAPRTTASRKSSVCFVTLKNVSKFKSVT
jgi:hypothetical protein